MGVLTRASLLVPIALLACTSGSDPEGTPSAPSRSVEFPGASPGPGRIAFAGDDGDGEIHVLSLPRGDDQTVTSMPARSSIPTATDASSSSGTRAPA